MGYCPKCGTVMEQHAAKLDENGNVERDYAGRPQTKGATHTANRTAGGAATGAVIGSVIPGVGTLLGGAIGGIAGFISGICKDDEAEHLSLVYICPKCGCRQVKKIK